MSYSLGIDVGTTFVAAAVAKTTTVEMFTLGDHAQLAPAAVYLGHEGTVATGEAATRHVKDSPDRIGRGMMTRLGDPTPMFLGNELYEITDLVSVLLRDVVHKVTQTQGKPPESVVLTHPASWGPFRLALFEKAARQAGLRKPTMVTEADAAAARYAASRSWNEGETVAVYDLGGGTFNATVLRKQSGKVQILGKPERIEGLGGDNLDEAILAHVNHTAATALTKLDTRRPETMAAFAGLRQGCIRAKEALSIEVETTFPVFLPTQRFDVRLTRSDFEDMARGSLESTIEALSRALQSAQVQPADLGAVLLAGGSSSIPLVAEMVSAALARPVIVDSHPQYVVALGAAALAAQVAQQDGPQHEGRHYRSRQNGSQAASYGTTAGSPTPTARVASAAEQHAPQSLIPPQRSNYMIPSQRTTDVTSPQRAPLREMTVAAGRPALRRGAAGPDVGAVVEASVPLVPPPPTPSPPPVDSPPADKRHEGPEGVQSPLSALVGRARQPRVLIGSGVAVALTGSILLALFTGGNNTPAPTPSSFTHPPKPRTTPMANVGAEVALPAISATIRVGNDPNFVTVSPDGRFAYITNKNSQLITMVDTALNQVTATIPISTGPPQSLTFAPDGRRLYVTVSNDQGTVHAIDVLDTSSNTVIATIPQLGMPLRVAVAPDGQRLFIANHMLPFVSVVDTATNTVIGQVNVVPNPHSVTFSPDGGRAYTANHESNLVSVIDTATLDVLATIPVGNSPHSIAVNPHLPLVANVNFNGQSVSEINTTTDAVVATIPVGKNPQDIAWAPDGRFAYVVNDGSNSVSVIDTTTNQVTKTIPTGASPTSIAVQPNGHQAYVSNLNSGTVTVLKLTP